MEGNPLWQQFRELQQRLMLAKTEEEAKEINQRITMILDLLDEENEEE